MKKYLAIAFACALLIGCNKQSYKTTSTNSVNDHDDDDGMKHMPAPTQPGMPYPGPGISLSYALVPIDGDDALDFNESARTENGSKIVEGISNSQYRLINEKTLVYEDGTVLTGEANHSLNSNKVEIKDFVPRLSESGSLVYPTGYKCVKNVDGVAHKVVVNDGTRTRDVCAVQVGFKFSCSGLNEFLSAIKSKNCHPDAIGAPVVVYPLTSSGSSEK